MQILPLVGIRAFEIAKPVAMPEAKGTDATSLAIMPGKKQVVDTVVVPAQREGFERVFLGENCWYAIRLSGGMLDNIKFIAAYQTAPISAVTHWAPVKRIEPYGDSGKYKLIFSEKAKEIAPIAFADATKGPHARPSL